MRVLLVRTDSPFWDEALCWAQRLHDVLGAEYLALGVAPDAAAADRMGQGLAQRLPLDRQRVRQGDLYQQVLAEIDEKAYDLIIVGADVGRPGELHHPPTAEYIAQQSQVPVAIVRSCPENWNRILICARAPDPTLPVSRQGAALAARLDAIPTVLHVIQPPPHGTAPPLDLPLGLADGLIKVRHGIVQDEIRAEVETGDYQIAVVGAHTPAPARAPEELTLAQPDIMRQVFDLRLPVVIVIGQQPALPPVEPEAPATVGGDWRRMVAYVVAEMLVYGLLVVAYALVAFRFLVDRLNDWFHNNPTLYAILALLLIVGQGILLEELTTFLLNRLRLERFE